MQIVEGHREMNSENTDYLLDCFLTKIIHTGQHAAGLLHSNDGNHTALIRQ